MVTRAVPSRWSWPAPMLPASSARACATASRQQAARAAFSQLCSTNGRDKRPAMATAACAS
eukprot:scaffold11792_cov112-Isochrysis_galbana.AAC.3